MKRKMIDGSGTFVTQWGYNSADRVAWLKYPSNNQSGVTAQLNTSYLPQLVVNSLSGLESVVQSSSYDQVGRVVARRLGSTPSLVSAYGYYPWSTQGGRLQTLKAGTTNDPTSLQDYTYSYDDVGNITGILDNKAGGSQTQSFGYDTLDRLTSASALGGNQGVYTQESYAYDATKGNLSSNAGVSYSYNAQVSCEMGSRTIAHAVSGAGSNTYSYDCNGKMTQRVVGGASNTLTYDAENHLTGVSGAATATFVYDGDGKRVKGTVGGVTITYIGELAEWSNNAMMRYYYAGSVRVGMNQVGTLYFLLGDHLGSASIVATNSGSQYSKVLFKPWGSDRYTSGTAPTSYRFTGQRAELGIGLYYYGARWLDSSLGRFIQPDSIIPEQSQGVQAWDRYAYVNNNPVRYNDPSGHCIDPDSCPPSQPSQSEYSDWYSGDYSGCRMCHYAKAQNRPVLTNEELETSDQNFREWAALGYTPLMVTTTVVGGVEVSGIAGGNLAINTVTYSVYRLVENGATKYVGITINLGRRAAEHLA